MTRTKQYWITSVLLTLVIILNTGLTTFGMPLYQSTTTNYTYDGRGNLISDGTYCIEYNGRNLPSAVNDCATNQPLEKYYYEPNGRRFKVETYQDGTLVESVLNMDDFVEITTNELTGQKETSYYVHANGNLLAKILPNGDKQFYHTDHLSSVVAITDQSGNPVGNRTYYGPYGNQITPNQPGSAYGYTGQELDRGTGYNWYNSRPYDPRLGTFLAPDGIRPSTSPKDLNPYAYVYNNPLNYTDPTGNEPNQRQVATQDQLVAWIAQIEQQHPNASQREILKIMRQQILGTNGAQPPAAPENMSYENRIAKYPRYIHLNVPIGEVGSAENYIDMLHFVAGAEVGMVTHSVQSAKDLGAGLEVGQFFVGDQSHNSPEDRNSNIYGGLFGTKIVKDTPLHEQLDQFFTEIGTGSPSNMSTLPPGYENLPATDSRTWGDAVSEMGWIKKKINSAIEWLGFR